MPIIGILSVLHAKLRGDFSLSGVTYLTSFRLSTERICGIMQHQLLTFSGAQFVAASSNGSFMNSRCQTKTDSITSTILKLHPCKVKDWKILKNFPSILRHYVLHIGRP